MSTYCRYASFGRRTDLRYFLGNDATRETFQDGSLPNTWWTDELGGG